MNSSASTFDQSSSLPPLRRTKNEAPTANPTAPTSQTTSVVVPPPPPGRSRRRAILAVVALMLLGVGAHYGLRWWTTGRFEETTDDAFLQADKVTVAPKVGGFVAESFVTDNQAVKAGDVLARIDDRDYQVVLLQDQSPISTRPRRASKASPRP